MNHDWNNAEIFCAVANAKSFTKAADLLDIPKSTISRSVAQFENALGIQLLVRNTRGVKLNPAGEELLNQLSPMFERLHGIIEQSLIQRDHPHGVLRISTPFEFGILKLNQVVCNLLNEHTGLEADIEMSTESYTSKAGDFDVIFSLQEESLEDSDFIARKVFPVPSMLCASPEFIKRMGAPTHPSELSTWPCIAESKNALWRFSSNNSAEIIEVPVHGRLRTSNTLWRLGATELGVGISVLSSPLCQEALKSGNLVEVLPDFIPAPRLVYAFIPTRKLMPSRVSIFLDALSKMNNSLSAADNKVFPNM